MTPTYHFRLPETVRAGEFLRSPSLRNSHHDARYFTSLILTKLARRDLDECGYLRLIAKHLRNAFLDGVRNTVHEALKQLNWEQDE